MNVTKHSMSCLNVAFGDLLFDDPLIIPFASCNFMFDLVSIHFIHSLGTDQGF